MTLSVQAIWLYAGALAAIWLTPGPVWVAIMARGLSSGWAGVWPLALGVAIGDMIWPLIAIFGLTLLVGDQAALLSVLRWIAVAVFLGMGIGLLFSVPLGVGISGLEIIVVLVQAYVFTLFTSLYIGMARADDHH